MSSFSIYFPPKFGNITFFKSGYFLIHIDIIMAYEFNLLISVPVYGSTERKKYLFFGKYNENTWNSAFQI